jgi:hypothetical protein
MIPAMSRQVDTILGWIGAAAGSWTTMGLYAALTALVTSTAVLMQELIRDHIINVRDLVFAGSAHASAFFCQAASRGFPAQHC